MKHSERGFTLIEILISTAIIALASAAAGGAIYQVMKNTQHNSDQMTAVRQVENAGHWISRDIQMASSVNVTVKSISPDFLTVYWTKWNVPNPDPVYYTARYYFVYQTGGIGTLKRSFTSTDGINQTTLIAQYVYFNTSDPTNTSNASLQDSLLKVKLTARVNGTMESKEYDTAQRPSY